MNKEQFLELMKEQYSGFGTHQMVLLEALKSIKGPVLELGAGEYSTVLIHKALPGVKILTLDHDPEWLSKYEYLKNEFHEFRCVSNEDIQEFYDNDTQHWGLVFIDYGTENPDDPWRARIGAMLKYNKSADYIILHDCDALLKGENPFGTIIRPLDVDTCDMGIRDYSKVFRYWIEFFVEGWQSFHPPVLIGSNKINLDDFHPPGMIISNRNGINSNGLL
jgi:hypothetical protein